MLKGLGKLVKGVLIGLGVLVVLVLVFGGRNSSNNASNTQETAATSQAQEQAAQSGEAQSEAEQSAQEEAAAGEDSPSIATNSKYAVSINGFQIVEDYDGAPCIAVDFTFTNVSDDSATSMQVATDITVYQNGVECEDAWFATDNSDGYTNKIKSGTSVEVTRVYKLQDTTSDVEIEVGELFSWNDDLLAYQVYQIA